MTTNALHQSVKSITNKGFRATLTHNDQLQLEIS